MNRVEPTYRSTVSNASISGTFVGFAFSGKEKDLETGLSYFGARYYDADLTTGWLSVDPMADKYPGMSPYNYCAGNPVKLVDPDGEEFISDGWIVDHSSKTVTHISDKGGNTDQYVCSPDGMFPLTYKNTSITDLRKFYECDGYRLVESSDTKFGLGLSLGSMALSATNDAVFKFALDNTINMQTESTALRLGLNYSQELRVFDGLSSCLTKMGAVLGSIGVGCSAIQLLTDRNVEDAIFHFMDLAMGSLALLPGPQQPFVSSMSLAWSLFGRQSTKTQAESFITIQEMGWNPGHCMFAPFK